jgi:hypothetical protein
MPTKSMEVRLSRALKAQTPLQCIQKAEHQTEDHYHTLNLNVVELWTYPSHRVYFFLLEWECLGSVCLSTAIRKNMTFFISEALSWREICLRTNPTLNLAHIWFTLFLDETLDLGFKVDLEPVQASGVIEIKLIYFACEKDMNWGKVGAECHSLNAGSPKFIHWNLAPSVIVSESGIWGSYIGYE